MYLCVTITPTPFVHSLGAFGGIKCNIMSNIDISKEKEYQKWLRKQIKNATSCERVIECYDSLRTSIYLCKHAFDNPKKLNS